MPQSIKPNTMLVYSTKPTESVSKRKRIVPMHTTSVEQRIKQKQAELGLNKFELKWLAICNEVKTLQNKSVWI